MSDSVGVVVLNYNSTSETEGCVESLLRQRQVDLHIVIVDNASRRPDVDALRRYLDHAPPNVTGVFNAENLGYGEGNNVGIRALRRSCSPRYLCVSNPDINCDDPRMLRRLVDVLDQLPRSATDWPTLVAPQVVDCDGNLQNPVMWTDYSPGQLWRERAKYCWPLIRNMYYAIQLVRYVGLAHRQQSRSQQVPLGIHRVFALHGSFLMFDASSLDWGGIMPPFDPGIFLFKEELALGRTLSKLGLGSYLVADARVRHTGDSSIDSSWGSRKSSLTLRYHHESTRYVLSKLY